MTIREYIDAKMKQWNIGVSNETLLIAFSVLNIEETEELTAESEVKSAYKILYRVIPDILISLPKSISEGGYSITYDKESIVSFYTMVANRLGLPDNLPNANTVKDITNKW